MHQTLGNGADFWIGLQDFETETKNDTDPTRFSFIDGVPDNEDFFEKASEFPWRANEPQSQQDCVVAVPSSFRWEVKGCSTKLVAFTCRFACTPTESPTESPTSSPSESPSPSPTTSPTFSPTKNPTLSPSQEPQTNIGAIVGGTIAGGAFFIAVGLLLLVLSGKWKFSSSKTEVKAQELETNAEKAI